MNVFLLLAIAAALLLPGAAAAQQQSATIRGVVAGPDGQPVSGATVLLLDQRGSQVAAAHTASDGRFRLENISPGSYTVFAEASSQRSNAHIITVQTALPIAVDLTLVARAAESVLVPGTADAPPVTTRVTLAGEALRQVPTRLQSRGVQQMLATLPGWSTEDNGLVHVRGVDDGVLYVEDGVPVYDRMDIAFGVAPDPAGIGTVNVLTGYIPPEYGLKSGAVLEVQSAPVRSSGWVGTVDAGVGGDALRSMRALGGGSLGGRANVGGSVASERSDRFLDPVHPDNFHNDGGVISGDVHVRVLASAADFVKLSLAAGRSRYQVPHGRVQEEAGQDQRQHLRQNSQSGSWQRFWSDDAVSHLAVYRREVDADLRSDPNSTPLWAVSDRRQRRVGGLASVTFQRGRHTAKTGVEAAHFRLREDFSFAVVDSDDAEMAEISDRASSFTLDRPFLFRDRASRSQWSFFVQDRIGVTDRFTVDFGVRFDRTRLLVPASQWSPRAGVAYAWPGTSTTLRASINRFFQPPQPEHLLLASSEGARALSPFADDEDEPGGAEVAPERQTAWEIGVDQRIRGVVRLDAAFWSRHVRNYADPNIFCGTTIIFPNSVARGTARGLDLRLEMARYRGWSSYASYTLSKVEQVGPINGGLFLEANIIDIGPGTRFTPDHDQRHTAAAGLSHLSAERGLSASVAARYESGTPLEVEPEALEDLMQRPGADRVNGDSGRVRPRTIVDATVAQVLLKGDRVDTTLRVSVLNVTNRAYALNFGNPFSGTHFGAPRTFRVDLQVGMR